MCNLCLILTAVIISAQLVVILTSLQHSFGLRSHRRKKITHPRIRFKRQRNRENGSTLQTITTVYPLDCKPVSFPLYSMFYIFCG